MTAPATSLPLEGAPPAPAAGELVRRHRLSTRLWHWTNAVALLVLLMSGLMIFNAHPRLYWGEYGANYDPAWLEIESRGMEGFLRLGSLEIETTGVLGVWRDEAGQVQRRAFPGWATIPSYYSLSDARLWHLAFAWVLAVPLLLYMVWSLFNRHIGRDLRVRAREVGPQHLWHDIVEHSRLRFPVGEAARRYGILQKLSYVAVIFILLPLVILTGIAMSPNLNASLTFLLDLFGGRQSARSLHFIATVLLVLFAIGHVLLVLLSGPLNQLRGIVTGWYRLPGEHG